MSGKDGQPRTLPGRGQLSRRRRKALNAEIRRMGIQGEQRKPLGLRPGGGGRFGSRPATARIKNYQRRMETARAINDARGASEPVRENIMKRLRKTLKELR